jgi:hypothetical protein
MSFEGRENRLHLAKVEAGLGLSPCDVLTGDAARPLSLDEELHDRVMLEHLG